MTIHQFNMQYNPEEDRILLRMNTVNKEEFRFFLTRRFTRLLWPVLRQIMDNDLKRREPDKARFTNEMLEFERENVISKANFKQKYSENITTYPLGEAFILLSRIQVKRGPDFDILCLHPSNGRGIEFPVNNAFLHPLCKILKDTAAKAEWDLDPVLTDTNMAGTAQPQKRVLH